MAVVIIYWICRFEYKGIGILMTVRKLIEFHLMGIKRFYFGSYNFILVVQSLLLDYLLHMT